LLERLHHVKQRFSLVSEIVLERSFNVAGSSAFRVNNDYFEF